MVLADTLMPCPPVEGCSYAAPFVRWWHTMQRWCAVFAFLSAGVWWSVCLAVPKNTFSLSLGYRSMQETLNQSFVFRGTSVAVDYGRLLLNDSIVRLKYAPEISFAGMWSHRMSAFSLACRPLDFACTAAVWRSPLGECRLGGCLWTCYDWRLYPSQHASQLFAYGELALALEAELEGSFAGHALLLRVRNSLLGFTSLTDTYQDWFYSFSFRDFVVEPHRHLRFGSFERFTHTEAALQWTPSRLSEHTFALEMSYVWCRAYSVYRMFVCAFVWRRNF